MINNQENKISGIILAGGRGSRLSKFTEEIPKPLIPILGKPVMEYQIEKMVDAGIKEIYVTVGYLKEKIIDYFGDGTKYGCHITYIKEDSPLGSAGGFFSPSVRPVSWPPPRPLPSLSLPGLSQRVRWRVAVRTRLSLLLFRESVFQPFSLPLSGRFRKPFSAVFRPAAAFAG